MTIVTRTYQAFTKVAQSTFKVGELVGEIAARPMAAKSWQLTLPGKKHVNPYEALRLAQVELESSELRFVDLFDFAQVGYVTVNTTY